MKLRKCRWCKEPMKVKFKPGTAKTPAEVEQHASWACPYCDLMQPRSKKEPASA